MFVLNEQNYNSYDGRRLLAIFSLNSQYEKAWTALLSSPIQSTGRAIIVVSTVSASVSASASVSGCFWLRDLKTHISLIP